LESGDMQPRTAHRHDVRRVLSGVNTIFMLEQEVAADRWEPLGLVEGNSPETVTERSAELAIALTPGRFRCHPVTGIGAWRYLEFDPDGLLLEPLR
jgi:hypothetical protein